LPEALLTMVGKRAKNENIPYQRFIPVALERALQEGK